MTQAELTAATERLDGLATAYVESDEGREITDHAIVVGSKEIIRSCLELAFKRGYERGRNDGSRFIIDGLTKGEK